MKLRESDNPGPIRMTDGFFSADMSLMGGGFFLRTRLNVVDGLVSKVHHAAKFAKIYFKGASLYDYSGFRWGSYVIEKPATASRRRGTRRGGGGGGDVGVRWFSDAFDYA